MISNYQNTKWITFFIRNKHILLSFSDATFFGSFEFSIIIDMIFTSIKTLDFL